MAKRYNLKSEIQRVAAKHPPFELQLPAIGEEAAEGYLPERIVKVPSAQPLPDDVAMLSARDPARAAEMILGDAYPQFVAAGGTGILLNELIRDNAGAESSGESPAS